MIDIVAAIVEIDVELTRAAYAARVAQDTARPYVAQHLREAELLAESARVQLQYARLALEGDRR